MREINVKLCEITTRILSIGFEGEQNHTQVAFDCSPIFEEYPDAVATLAVKPPVGDVYPKNVTRDGNEVLWDVSASDCAHNGNGEYQITFVNGNEIIKTWTGNMRLYSSLLANGNPPEPIDDWIEDANAVLGSIENMTASAEGLPAGSDPTAEMSDIGGHKNIAFGIPAGEQGEQGEPGEDGFSPVITVTEITGGHRITIMDAEGIQTVDVLDGEKGDTGNGISSCVLNQDYTLTITYTNGQSYTTPSIRGEQGEQGNPGADGYSPTATVSKSGSVVTITITDKNGTTSATVEDGEKGETGATPVISIGTVSTLEPGESATASMDTTDPEHPVLSLGIPEGQPGEVTQAEFDALQIAKADIITDTASGAIASFPDGADGMPVQSLSVAVEPVQDLHGYDSPWPAGGGKNKIPNDYNFESGTTKEGVTATINADGSVRVVSAGTGTATAFFELNVLSNPNIVLPAGTYSASGTISGKVALAVKDAALNRNLATPFTLTEEAGIFVYLSCYSTTAYDVTIYPQIESGSTATSWTPYSNICPITGWTGAKVTKTGKNVLNLSEWECESNSGITIGTDNISVINKGYQETLNRYNVLNRLACVFSFHVKTVSLNDSRASFAVYADGVKRSGSGTDTTGNIELNSVGTEKDITITVPDGTEYISFGGWAWGGEVQISNLQLSLGPTATAYEPYQGETYDIAFPSEAGTVYGGSLSIAEDGSGVLTVDRAYALLNDLNKWTTSPSNTVNFIYQESFGNRKKTNESYSGLLCSYYRVDSSHQNDTARWVGASANEFGLKSASLTIEQIKADAAEGKIAIAYPLATPITYTLTASQIRTLLGQNNIWADTGDTTVTYRADTKAYINKVIAAAVAAL